MSTNLLYDIIYRQRLVIHLHGSLDNAFCQADINSAVIHNAISQQTIDGTLQITHTAITGLSNETNNLLGDFQAITTYLIAQDIHTELLVRFFQFTYQTTRETRQKAIWHIFQIYW